MLIIVQRDATIYSLFIAPDDGWCYHPKHIEEFATVNKLYIVAPRWTIINID